MNTPSHTIINLVALGRNTSPSLNYAIILGSILPDIAIFWFYFWSKWIKGLPDNYIWSKAYFSPAWQDIFAVPNSFILCGIGLGIASYFQKPWWQFLFLSMILHLICDIAVHHDDAHRHFFPLSNYRFISPLSYWDVRHYGRWVALFELITVVGCSLWLGKQSPWWGKALLFSNSAFYIFFYLQFYLLRLIQS
ncbi:MAG: hypothetical protein AB4058_05910 [Microcystaceae cyanobacterium]